MTENVQSAMLEILKRIQADVSQVKDRVSRLADHSKRQGRDTAAMLVMMRGTVGVFDERLRHVEDDVRRLMERD